MYCQVMGTPAQVIMLNRVDLVPQPLQSKYHSEQCFWYYKEMQIRICYL